MIDPPSASNSIDWRSSRKVGKSSVVPLARLEAATEIAYNLANRKDVLGLGKNVTLDLLLKELVSSVDGATGAIILADDGEAVQWYSLSNSSERLQLRGAYLAVVMRAFRGSASRAGLGGPMNLVVEYDGANLVALEIEDDCLVVLELKVGTDIGHAIYRVRTSRDKFRDVITA
jgi:predicted regulator of Ras-like GTPase activity (Roadblock/LC7/MglB family)